MAYKTTIPVSELRNESALNTFLDKMCNFLGEDFSYSSAPKETNPNIYDIKLYFDKGNLNYITAACGFQQANLDFYLKTSAGANTLSFGNGSIMTIAKSAKGTAAIIGKKSQPNLLDFANGYLTIGECEDGYSSYMGGIQSSFFEARNDQLAFGGNNVALVTDTRVNDIILTPRWSYFGGAFKEIYQVVALRYSDTSLVIHNENGYFQVAQSSNVALAIPIDYIPD